MIEIYRDRQLVWRITDCTDLRGKGLWPLRDARKQTLPPRAICDMLNGW